MDEITSVTNERVKRALKIASRGLKVGNYHYFLLEGEKSVKSLIELSLDIEQIFVLKQNFKKYPFLSCLDNVVLTNEKVMNKISTTSSFCDILAIGKKKSIVLNDIKDAKRVVFLENIKDPGNLGTIIRSCCAFGMDALILSQNSVDIYNTKTIRSTAGNLFKIKIVKLQDNDFYAHLKQFFPSHKFIATTVNGKDNLKDFEFSEKFIIFFGSEAFGLSDYLLSQKFDSNLTIEMKEDVESLNLSVSCSIILYHSFV